jgi:hypothetical protein
MSSTLDLEPTDLDEIVEYIYARNYKHCADILDQYIEGYDILSLISLIASKSLPIFPSQEILISSSSKTVHPTLSGNLQNRNAPNQFIFHTNDRDPWVIIDLGTNIVNNYPLYLYNRCQSREISERIIGCRFLTSKDQDVWHDLGITLSEDQIYNHKAIEIRQAHELRFIKISRSNSATPIHLSQITFGAPLELLDSSLEFSNFIFAKKHNLKVGESGGIIEHYTRKLFIRFNYYDNSRRVSLRISQIARFSNFVIQLTNAIFLASKWNIPNIVLPEHPRVRNLIPSADIFKCKNYPVTISIGGTPKGICLEGNFFYGHEMRPNPGNVSLSELVNEFKDYCGLSPNMPDNDLRTLTIHIRSGDIFGDKDVHPRYGQPPLCFYREAINHYNPDLVNMVFENDLNPVIPALTKYLESASIRYCIYSSINLREDIHALISASALVIGRGTFAHGVISLAENLKTLYTFNEPLPNRILSHSLKQVINNIVITDSKGDYTNAILKKNWGNSPEQRTLMLNYSSDYLDVKDSSDKV